MFALLATTPLISEMRSGASLQRWQRRTSSSTLSFCWILRTKFLSLGKSERYLFTSTRPSRLFSFSPVWSFTFLHSSHISSSQTTSPMERTPTQTTICIAEPWTSASGPSSAWACEQEEASVKRSSSH